MMTYIGCVEGGRGREREREINQWGGGRDSFRISKCLLGSACAFSLGGKGKKQKQEGVDNIRKGGLVKGWKRVTSTLNNEWLSLGNPYRTPSLANKIAKSTLKAKCTH